MRRYAKENALHKGTAPKGPLARASVTPRTTPFARAPQPPTPTLRRASAKQWKTPHQSIARPTQSASKASWPQTPAAPTPQKQSRQATFQVPAPMPLPRVTPATYLARHRRSLGEAARARPADSPTSSINDVTSRANARISKMALQSRLPNAAEGARARCS